MDAVEKAVVGAFALFASRYGKRWDIPASAVPGWAASLAADGAKPEEILRAAKAWSDKQRWPPCYAELRGAIPRFCSCGRCSDCNRRAHATATRLANAGCFGSAPEAIGSHVADAIEQALPGRLLR